MGILVDCEGRKEMKEKEKGKEIGIRKDIPLEVKVEIMEVADSRN